MSNQKNKYVIDVLQKLNYLKASLAEATQQIEQMAQPIQRTGYDMNGCKVMNTKLLKIIYAAEEHCLEKTVDGIVTRMETYPSEYIDDELSERLNLWSELCYMLHSEEYFYEHDFLFMLSTQMINETEVTNHTEFNDASERQKAFGETVFSIIEEYRNKLKDYEKAMIWGLENDCDGNDWFFSGEEYDSELAWNDEFIDNHLYSLLLDKAQKHKGMH